MIWLIAIGVAATAAAGVYLTLSRDLLRTVVGVSLIAAAANLIVFASGRPGDPRPPVIQEGLDTLSVGANPLPQALVLTAIVIGFALTCFSLILALALAQKTRALDTSALREVEPPAAPDGGPPIEEGPHPGDAEVGP